jgi:AraC-like DNA-binding protein
MLLEHASSGEEWAQLATRRFVGLRVDAAARQFSGAIRSHQLGSQVGVAGVSTSAVNMARSDDLVSRFSDDAVFLSVQMRGPFRVQQGDRAARVTAGEAVLYRADAPFRLICEAETSCLTIRVAPEAISWPQRQIRDAAARAIPASLPELHVLTEFLQIVDRGSEHLDAERTSRMGVVGASLFDALIGALFAEAPQPSSSLVSAERMRVFVLDHLHDPDLSPVGVAERFRVSVRTVSTVFASAGLPSPAAYIRARRVEAAKKLLIGREFGLTEIALRAGFNSATTFARAFKQVSGFTPSEWRSRQHEVVLPESA